MTRVRGRRSFRWGIAAGIAAAACLLAWLIVVRGSAPGQPSGRAAEAEKSASAAPIQPPAYGPVQGPRFRGSNVVVITIDTLRRDHVAPYGARFATPAATRLAREGVVFDHAVSQVPLTLPSHASIFTGLYPPHHAVRDNGGFVLGVGVTTLAERLQSSGYRTAAFVASYVLHSRWGLAQGHETYDDSFDYAGLTERNLTAVERPAVSVIDAAIGWLQAHRGEHPFYLWVHLNDPHEPYVPPASYRQGAPDPYSGEVMYADAQAARLLAALDSLGLRRTTSVLYLSDHGEALGEHGEPTHGIFLYGATLDVPLIVAPPTRGTADTRGLLPVGSRVEGLARLVDVSPTVLDLVGLPAPSGLDGASLLPLVAHEGAVRATSGTPAPAGPAGDALAGPVSYAETYYPRFHFGWSELAVAQTSRWKYVRAPRPELYDVVADRAERHDVSASHPDVAARLAAQLDAVVGHDAAEPTPASIDPEALERLRSLGYVSGSESAARAATGPRPDPKDKLPLLRELTSAVGLRDSGQLDEARRRLEDLARRDAENPAVHLVLSSVYLKANDKEGAIASAKRAVALDPESANAVMTLASSYQAAGQTKEAATGFERVLALDPDNLKAVTSLADLLYRAGERQKAFGLYQRAATLAPQFAQAQVDLASVALELSRLDVAESALARARALGGSEPGLHFNLGLLAEQQGQPTNAAREYRAEVTAHPDAFKAWINLGLLQRQGGDVRGALASFERAANAQASEMAGPFLLAETLSVVGRRQDAQRWAREALRRSPGDPQVQELVRKTEGRR